MESTTTSTNAQTQRQGERVCTVGMNYLRAKQVAV